MVSWVVGTDIYPTRPELQQHVFVWVHMTLGGALAKGGRAQAAAGARAVASSFAAASRPQPQ